RVEEAKAQSQRVAGQRQHAPELPGAEDADGWVYHTCCLPNSGRFGGTKSLQESILVARSRRRRVPSGGGRPAGASGPQKEISGGRRCPEPHHRSPESICYDTRHLTISQGGSRTASCELSARH